MANCALSLAQVEEMTLYEARLLFDYWNEAPPANEILAAVHSVEHRKERELTVEDVQNMPTPQGCMSIAELRAAFQKNGGLKLVTDNGG
jgi:hypothetical protein